MRSGLTTSLANVLSAGDGPVRPQSLSGTNLNIMLVGAADGQNGNANAATTIGWIVGRADCVG